MSCPIRKRPIVCMKSPYPSHSRTFRKTHHPEETKPPPSSQAHDVHAIQDGATYSSLLLGIQWHLSAHRRGCSHPLPSASPAVWEKFLSIARKPESPTDSSRKADLAMVTVSCAKICGMSIGLSEKKIRPLPSFAISRQSSASTSLSVPRPITEMVAPSSVISFMSFL